MGTVALTRSVSFDRARATPLATVAAFVFVLASTVTAPYAAAAVRCPSGAGGGERLGQVDAGQRLSWIDQHLSRTAHAARVWTWGWGVGIGVATAANLVPLLFVAPANRIDWYIGAGTTVVGIVPLLIAPLDVIDDAGALHAKIVAAPRPPGVDDDGLCTLLGDAEARLVKDAKNQADGQRWWLHVGNVVLNTGVGLFLGLGYHHWGTGALNAILGSAIGEAIILTQPTSTIGDLRAYRTGEIVDGPGTLVTGGISRTLITGGASGQLATGGTF